MSLYEIRDIVQQIQSRTGRPVRASLVSEVVGYSTRHTQRILNEAEDVGLLRRRSPRSGWLVCRTG